MALDVRQEALVNRRVIGRGLNEPDWLEQSPDVPARAAAPRPGRQRVARRRARQRGPARHRHLRGDRLLPAPLRQALDRALHHQHGRGRGRRALGAAARPVGRAAQAQRHRAARHRAGLRDDPRPAGRRRPDAPALRGARLPGAPRRPPPEADRHARHRGQQRGERPHLGALGAAQGPAGTARHGPGRRRAAHAVPRPRRRHRRAAAARPTWTSAARRPAAWRAACG